MPGGVFGNALVLGEVSAALGAPMEPRLPPVGGAVLTAARRAGWDVGPAFVARLAVSLSQEADTFQQDAVNTDLNT